MNYERVIVQGKSNVTYMNHSSTKFHFFEYRRFFFAVILVLLLFFAVIFLFPERSASASNTTSLTYHIASVQIEQGDSLWSIAEEYFTKEFSSIQDYIKEIKRMNCMENDVIFEGGYLLIPYYAE